MSKQLTGTIFYASKDAQSKHLYKEGQHLTQDRPNVSDAGFKDIYYHGRKVERDTTSFTQRVYMLEDDVIKTEEDMRKSSDCMMKILNDPDRWRADEQKG